MPWVRVDEVEEAAWRALETFLVSPEVVFDQVGNADHQIEVLETQLQEIELEKMELDRRRSRLLDLYERSETDMLEELDDRMDRIKKARETLDRRQLECQERVTYYRQQKVDPDQVYRVLSQIEEIIRFATPAHRRIGHTNAIFAPPLRLELPAAAISGPQQLAGAIRSKTKRLRSGMTR
jgi:hypothetical protein